MTMAQFSREDILIYQGRDEGREEGIKAFILDKVEDGVAESIIIQKLRKHFTLDEKAARQEHSGKIQCFCFGCGWGILP